MTVNYIYILLLILIYNFYSIIGQDIDEAEFFKFKENCIVPNTRQLGRFRREKYCPFAIAQKQNGVTLPRACSYEICADMVCCPDTPIKRLRQQCKHENVIGFLRSRIQGNFACTVPGINKPGRYTRSKTCSYYADKISKNQQLPKICEWEICKDYVCCPETHLKGGECRISNDYNFDYIDFSAGMCTMKETGARGVCTSKQLCPSQASHLNKKNTICGYDCCSSFVCCPLPEFQKLSISGRACYAYKSAVFEDRKVIKYLDRELDKSRSCIGVKPSGGSEVASKEFPHIAVLGYDVDGTSDIDWGCGGSLISDRFVLTAGHCLEPELNFPVKYVRLGIMDIDVTKNRNDCPEEYLVNRRYPHPAYSVSSTYNDIALLRLDRNVKFNPYIRPICLPATPQLPKYFIAAGFGQTSFDGDRTEKLLKVGLDFFDHRECNASYKLFLFKKFKGLNDYTQFCAGSRETIQDTCPGDSGTPIEGPHRDFYLMNVIYGVTSFGKACGYKDSPAVYTKVYPYIQWIESIVWPNQN